MDTIKKRFACIAIKRIISLAACGSNVTILREIKKFFYMLLLRLVTCALIYIYIYTALHLLLFEHIWYFILYPHTGITSWIMCWDYLTFSWHFLFILNWKKKRSTNYRHKRYHIFSGGWFHHVSYSKSNIVP